MRYIYKIIILLGVFIGSLIFMGKNIKEVTITLDTTVSMSEATFPILTIRSQNYEMNCLHGYSSNLDATMIRESITPIDAEKSFELWIDEKETDILRLKYEISEISTGEVLGSETISAFSEKNGKKCAEIILKCEFVQGREYAARFILTTTAGRKIYFYTRIKYYGEDTSIERKLNFIQRFHEQTFAEKGLTGNLSDYLETDYARTEQDLSHVDIHSGVSQVMWGNLEVEKVTEPVPMITEYNIETAAVVLSYFVKADAGSGKKELYRVREAYRVRLVTQQLYLLDYDRTMEAQFDIDLVSTVKNDFKVGIANEQNIQITTSSNDGKIAFVREGTLWYYNLAENKAVRVFTFLSDKHKKDYLRNYYDQHNISVINMSDTGEIDFMVYGYMNRGDYEGKVGIVLYHFYPDEKRIEEHAYIPVEATYQRLKEEIGNFGYVNDKGDFFFAINHNIYEYNVIANKLKVLASGVDRGEYIFIKGEKNYAAWALKDSSGVAKQITILDLETEKMMTIDASMNEGLRIFGSVDDNIIYGKVRVEDIATTLEGSKLLPAYEVDIADAEGNVLKTYSAGKYFVTEAQSKDNIIYLERVQKDSSTGAYKVAKPDNIINREIGDSSAITLSQRITELAEGEWYISLPGGFEMNSDPKVEYTVNTILTDSTTLYLDNSKTNTWDSRFYVYVYGQITDDRNTISDAIRLADEKMGTVTENGNVVWERGGKNIYSSITGLTPQSGENSIATCLSVMLQAEGLKVAPGALKVTGDNSILGVLSEYVERPYNLTGCTLDEVLYFVSKGSPVLAKKSQTDALLITGYDAFNITYMDPELGMTLKMSMDTAKEMFEKNGNVFVSYLTSK